MQMAIFAFLLLVMATCLIVASLAKSQGQPQDKALTFRGKGDQARHASRQSDRAHKEETPRRKLGHQERKQLPGQRRTNPNNFPLSYQAMSPPSFFNYRWNMGGAKGLHWWQGLHVCQRETERVLNSTGARAGTMQHFSTSSQVCDESEAVYKCTIVQENSYGQRVLTFVYECCHGYRRRKGNVGCLEKVGLLTVMETAEEMALTDFVKAVKAVKLAKEIEKGNVTLFVPVNGAFTFGNDLLNSEDAPVLTSVSKYTVDKALKTLRNVILSHVVQGTVTTSNMADEQVLKTGRSGDTTVRINYFSRPENLMTANCVPVISRDHMATNGVVHSVEKVLQPVTRTAMEIVSSRLELRALKDVIAAAKYASKIDYNRQMTLLAPTNSAFDKMNRRLKDRLLSGDRKCLERVLQNHLLPNVICSTAIQGQARTANQRSRFVTLRRDADNKIFVQGSQVIEADVMATNGVVHVIDAVLVPDEALSVLDLVRKRGHSEFLQLVEQAGLTSTLEEVRGLTLFVPSNDAILNLPATVKTKLYEDPKLLRDVLTFHLSPEVHDCRRILNDRNIPTLAGVDLRLNSFSTFGHQHHGVRTVQCVLISEANVEACNGRINVINDVMLPPKGNIIDILAMEKRFSALVALVKKSGLADDLQRKGPFTVLAPANEAFEKLGRRAIAFLIKDPKRLQKLITSHVIEGTLCCSGIFRRHFSDRSQVRTMAGDILRLSRGQDNRPRIGRALVTACDRTATNGNVLEIDRVLVHKSSRSR